MSWLGVPRTLKILHARPISPRVPLKRLVRVQRPDGMPGCGRVRRGMTNGVGGGVGGRGSLPDSDPVSDRVKARCSSSSSSSVCKRSEVKNSERVTPRLHASIAKASYVLDPKSNSGAR